MYTSCNSGAPCDHQARCRWCREKDPSLPAPAKTPSPGRWEVIGSQVEDVYAGELHFTVIAREEDGSGTIIADVESGPHAQRNAAVMAEAGELLRIARSAAVAFEEHLDCLEDELRDPFCNQTDAREQIDNYQQLLAQHREVIAWADGRDAA
jgi:hypothetical protein